MKQNTFFKGAALALAAAAALGTYAEPYEYTTKAINAYDHNGKLITSQLAPDVQYVEIEDYRLLPKTFTVPGSSVSFKMIPVIGTKSYKLKANNISSWPENDKQSVVNTFYIGETEVTNALWKAVTGADSPSKNKGDNYPVESATWNAICRPGGFLDQLNAVMQKNPEMKEMMNGYEFALPTEWEWEFAAAGGNQSKNYIYSGSNTASDVAWYADNSASEGTSVKTTHPVAQLQANELGIYDMSGNVWEWCSETSFRNKDNVIETDRRPNRGWSYATTIDAGNLAYTARGLGNGPDEVCNFVGIRLCLKEKTRGMETFTVTDKNGKKISFNMMPVPGINSYKLKANPSQWDDDEKYSVINSYSIGQTEVTNSLWKAVMGVDKAPSQLNSEDEYPVESVSWNQICQADGFLDKLNSMIEQDPEMKALMNGRKFYLPTEWEWEFAAAGGNPKQTNKYSGSKIAKDVAWYDGNPEGTSVKTTHPVAQLKANELGIYDMSGNVWEWCSGNSFRANDNADPKGDDTKRPSRGWSCASADPIYYSRGGGNGINEKWQYLGFRLVLK